MLGWFAFHLRKTLIWVLLVSEKTEEKKEKKILILCARVTPPLSLLGVFYYNFLFIHKIYHVYCSF